MYAVVDVGGVFNLKLLIHHGNVLTLGLLGYVGRTSLAAKVTREPDGTNWLAAGVSQLLHGSGNGSLHTASPRLTFDSRGVLGVHCHFNASKPWSWTPSCTLRLGQAGEVQRSTIGLVLRWNPEPRLLASKPETSSVETREPFAYSWAIGPVPIPLFAFESAPKA